MISCLCCFSGSRPRSGCPAGPGDGLPGRPTAPPAELRQRGELSVLLRRPHELALRPQTAAALLFAHHEPGTLRFPTQSDEGELDVAPVSQVPHPSTGSFKCVCRALLQWKECLTIWGGMLWLTMWSFILEVPGHG